MPTGRQPLCVEEGRRACGPRTRSVCRWWGEPTGGHFVAFAPSRAAKCVRRKQQVEEHPDTGSSRKVMVTDWSWDRRKTTQCVRFGITSRYLGHVDRSRLAHCRARNFRYSRGLINPYRL